jgi:hypothetical protein
MFLWFLEWTKKSRIPAIKVERIKELNYNLKCTHEVLSSDRVAT